MRVMLFMSLQRRAGRNLFGGAEKSIVKMANWMSGRPGIEVILVAAKGSLQGYSISSYLVFHEYEVNESMKVTLHWILCKEVHKVIKQYRPDVFVSFWVHPLLYAALSFCTHRPLLVYSGRNNPDSAIYSKTCRMIRWFVVRRVDGIVFQTREAMEFFNADVQKKSVVIHNAVSAPSFSSITSSEGQERIVSVGRLVPEKNHAMLIRAFFEIKDLFPKIILEIYGEGSLHEQLQQLIDSLRLSNRVHLMGEFPDIRQKMCGARLFVLPSLFEGMPNVLMEAMSLGLPVLASDCPCGGPRELIQDGVNGFLFENGNKEDLVGRMTEILGCADCFEIRDEARKICATHSEDRIFGQWLEYMRKLIL